MPGSNKLKSIRWLLMPLPLLLTACASQPPISPAACPQIPAKPALTQPQPSRSYSESARTDIETWRAALTATPPTRKP